jgi:hypothetical protein
VTKNGSTFRPAMIAIRRTSNIGGSSLVRIDDVATRMAFAVAL